MPVVEISTSDFEIQIQYRHALIKTWEYRMSLNFLSMEQWCTPFNDQIEMLVTFVVYMYMYWQFMDNESKAWLEDSYFLISIRDYMPP